MHIGTTNTCKEFTMHTKPNEGMIERVTKENDLGVTFDNELNFSKHSNMSKQGKPASWIT